MQRLTEKDAQGNWCLKGVRWEQLRAGQVITKDVEEKLYGALCKLRDYENTGASPDCIADLIKNYAKAMTLLAGQIEEHSWIPAEERLPEEDKWVKVTVKRHRWIADFDEENVPDEEKEEHPERVYCTLGRCLIRDSWEYLDLEDNSAWSSITNDCSQEDLSYPMTEVIAWMPLPEPYREKTQHE